MKYREYIEKSLDKRLGILGECHVYTSDESRKAGEIVRMYDVIAVEGSSRIGINAVLWLPFTLAYSSALGRSVFNDTALAAAKRQGKDIVYLEEDFKKSFTFAQRLLLNVFGLASIPLAPFAHQYFKLARSAARFDISAEKSDGFIYSLHNVPARDRIMAEKAAEIIRSHDNLLIVCGEAHVEGIEKILSSGLQLERVKQ